MARPSRVEWTAATEGDEMQEMQQREASESLIAEVQAYLAVVEVFRQEGREPTWSYDEPTAASWLVAA